MKYKIKNIMSDELFENIVANGEYWYPAKKHYRGLCSVSCDRCHKNDILVSIGYKDKDLCLDCVNFIIQRIDTHKKDQEKKILQEKEKIQNLEYQYNRCKTNDCGDCDECCTLMGADLFD